MALVTRRPHMCHHGHAVLRSHLQLLAEGKFDVAATDGHGYTAAFWAIQHGHLHTLEVLRTGGAKLDVTSLGGMYGTFDIVLDHVSQNLHPCPKSRAGWPCLRIAHAYWMLIGAFNLMLCPILVFRSMLAAASYHGYVEICVYVTIPVVLRLFLYASPVRQ